jgi:hypothetical protein
MKFRICHRGDFLSVQLCGVPSIRELLLCARSCERFQAAHSATRDWMIDLTSVRDCEVGLYEMKVIARRFESAAHPGLIRCAIVVQSQPEIGGARRSRTLSGRTEIEIRLFPSCDEALQWFSSTRKKVRRRPPHSDATPTIR